jgi:hypothetical protein
MGGAQGDAQRGSSCRGPRATTAKEPVSSRPLASWTPASWTLLNNHSSAAFHRSLCSIASTAVFQEFTAHNGNRQLGPKDDGCLIERVSGAHLVSRFSLWERSVLFVNTNLSHSVFFQGTQPRGYFLLATNAVSTLFSPSSTISGFISCWLSTPCANL